MDESNNIDSMYTFFDTKFDLNLALRLSQWRDTMPQDNMPRWQYAKDH